MTRGHHAARAHGGSPPGRGGAGLRLPGGAAPCWPDPPTRAEPCWPEPPATEACWPNPAGWLVSALGRTGGRARRWTAPGGVRLPPV